jgi:F0F1-type ATP synthase delta subunit
METSRPFQSFLSQLKTTDDVDRVSEALSHITTSLYKTSTKSIEEKMDEFLPSHVSQAIKEEMQTRQIQSTNIEEVKRLFSDLKVLLRTLSTVSLTLAFDPPQNTIDALAESVKQTFGSEAVIEISIQPHILGGALIVAYGRYIDKSLKRKLDILFEVKRAEIEQMINADSQTDSRG